jgi:nucleotide-binding universal stress UspA family protein
MYIRHIDIGDPARKILDFIDQNKVDMVVMATRGEKGDFPFGSVTEKVIKNASVPVVSIPTKEDEE